ncbi:G-protein coupled receptor 176-like [Salvelinus fontinalis]|uniref:G-protein coupled receptor 176-like n=1 Tax=Salvelinus fontinalis TaxID=8038 RepID=UPI002486BE08|nr:G-protein coupled receptor 176-like [Salvelinus fontinalis]
MDVGSWVPTAGDGTANFTPANLLLDSHNGSGPTPWDNGLSNNGQQRNITDQAYRDFTTTIQVLILIGSLLGNATVLWCTCCTNVFKSVTSRFIKNLACSGICAGLVCVPFDVALGASPRCCWWLHTLLLCKALKFLHKLFCSVTVLSFSAIALDRYYSVLYPLERKISDARSRDLVIYIWIHATIASVPVFAVTNVTDVYATSSCSDARARSLGHMVYVVTYNVTTVILPLVVVFLLMVLIRRALSASQKKKVIIAALRTPQNSISIPYVSQREAELHATLLAVVLAFSACSAPYGALVVYRTLLGDGEDLSPSLHLTAIWLPKVSLLTNPLLFLTVNGSARRCLFDVLVRVHRRYSRRNVVSTGDLGLRGEGGLGGSGALEGSARAGSQLLEMFNIGQQQIFRPTDEEEEEEVENESPSLGSGVGGCSHPKENHHQAGGGGRQGGKMVRPKETEPTRDSVPVTKEQPPLIFPEVSPVRACAYTSSSQVAPATPTDPEDATQFGFGPFELPPQWLPETRNSKKRLLPPLGNTPEELIQTKQPRPRPERRISRNNKVSTFPTSTPEL